MVLGVKDRAVLTAFLLHESADSRKLWTDGQRLDGHWMGGSNIAEWAAEHVVIHDLGSRSAQTVQRALKRLVPARQWGGYNRGPGEYWIAKALGTRPRRLGLRATGYTPKLHHPRHHVKSVRVEPAHRGELHRELGVPVGKKIPMAKLRAATRSHDPHLAKRARLAITLRGLGHGKRRK
jgi:hypothetical protein